VTINMVKTTESQSPMYIRCLQCFQKNATAIPAKTTEYVQCLTASTLVSVPLSFMATYVKKVVYTRCYQKWTPLFTTVCRNEKEKILNTELLNLLNYCCLFPFSSFPLTYSYFLQRGHITCNAEHCNSYGNSVRPSVRHTPVPYEDEWW